MSEGTATAPTSLNHVLQHHIANEVTDPHANQEVLSVCVQFLDLSTAEHPQIKEAFLDFVLPKCATGEKVGQAIMSVLSRNSLDVKISEGRPTMEQVQYPLALYTQCRSHVLNLAMAGSCKVQALRNVIGVLNELHPLTPWGN